MSELTTRKRFPWVTTAWALLGITIITAAGLWLLPWGRDLGTLEIHIKDHREAIDDFAKLELEIKKIRIGSQAGVNSRETNWNDLIPQVTSLDLTQLTGTRRLQVFRGELEPGTFEAIHLDLSRAHGILKKTFRPIPIENRIGPIRIPFSIGPRMDSAIVLDLVVLDISDHPPRGYELHIKGYELYEGGRLIDRVPPA